MLSVEQLADDINEHCENHELFWAAGIIKETLRLWLPGHNYKLLIEPAQAIVDRYYTD